MKSIYFKFREHPGDMFRGTLKQKLPEIDKEFEEFLVQFLPCYQRDNEIAYLNDLYKLLYDEYQDEKDKRNFIEYSELREKNEIKNEITKVEENLKIKALENFYYLVMNNKIKVFENYGKS